jgi:hypothetical protein
MTSDVVDAPARACDGPVMTSHRQAPDGGDAGGRSGAAGAGERRSDGGAAGAGEPRSDGGAAGAGEPRSDGGAAGAGEPPLAGALRGLAVGRVVLGAASLALPEALARGLGVPAAGPLSYMTRIFGARAIALGAGYLTAPPAERPRWQRLSLLVDASDTLTGLHRLRRRDTPTRGAAALVVLTGTYFAIGAARAAYDVRSARPIGSRRR